MDYLISLFRVSLFWCRLFISLAGFSQSSQEVEGTGDKMSA